MIDTATYYTRFMENMRLAEPLVWVSIRNRTITRPDFIAAMRRWAEDITSTKGTK